MNVIVQLHTCTTVWSCVSRHTVAFIPINLIHTCSNVQTRIACTLVYIYSVNETYSYEMNSITFRMWLRNTFVIYKAIRKPLIHYADDTQFHDSCKSTDAAVLAARAMRVIEAVRDWMSSNRLRLNADRTQFIWLGTSHFLDVLQINSIPANEVVSNLGVYFDPELLMERQVRKLCQVCYFHLRRLRTVRRSLTESLLTLVHAFITSRLDHCNGVLYGLNGYLLDRLQSVLNSTVRLIMGVPKFDGVSAAIRNELHWLPIGKRIQFKIALLVRHCIVGAAPEYLTELCRPVSSSSGQQSLRSASRGDFIVPRFRLRRSGYRAFAVSGPHVWNSLPTEIRQSCNNLLQFKSKLKTFLFQQSWALLWIHI